MPAELGRGCGSTAWRYGVWASDGWLVGMYPEQAQEEYWDGGPNTLCVSCLNPTGATRIAAALSGDMESANTIHLSLPATVGSQSDL